MIDHLTIRVRDYEKSKQFYLAALAPLGYELVVEFDIPGHGKFGGLGAGKKPDLWIAPAAAQFPATAAPFHFSLLAKTRAQVAAFHAAAIAAGGKDNGAAGPRTEYHPHYYGAFVLDPDGHNVEACMHAPE